MEGREMNERVEKRLESIKKIAEVIKDMCECIIDDCDDVMESSDLFIIEQQFERINRKSDHGYELTRDTCDVFDEEE
jgi:hypothetical protein